MMTSAAPSGRSTTFACGTSMPSTPAFLSFLATTEAPIAEEPMPASQT